MNTSRPYCHYCGGDGTLEERTDVDDYRDIPCNYCEGTGEAMHSANTNTRWVGPGYWIGGHYHVGDPLVLTARWRRVAIRAKCGEARHSLPFVRQCYGEIRQVAVSPVHLPDLRRELPRLAA